MLDKAMIEMMAQGIWDTCYMTLVSTFFGYVIGLPLGIALTLTDENGNVLDVYTVDPKTGTGTDSSNAEVNLPQTGNNSMTNWLLCVGAAMFMAFGFGAVKASGIFKRKEDE